ncbi:uncharacterized protein HaLaN_18575 [Haematococcus lacustris]|uniref:Uncharacterized protein n=1 Tax=Haematococcus lacustris TaxID=44745 RepID=A0A699ZJR0_HAELA|nr:uncharacterized protein HaLaN_18575 [Haematococcus lacustris]
MSSLSGCCGCAQALCLACGSDPEKGTAKKLGSFLMLTCFQTSTVSSAMFITGEKLSEVYYNQLATLLFNTGEESIKHLFARGTHRRFGYASLAVLGCYYFLGAATFAGNISWGTWALAGAFAITVGLWIFGGAIGVNAVTAAIVGLTILLVTNVTTWKADWLKFGFILSLVYLTVWLGVGGVWWKSIGLW